MPYTRPPWANPAATRPILIGLPLPEVMKYIRNEKYINNDMKKLLIPAMACLILYMVPSCHSVQHDDPANTAFAFPFLDTSLSFDQRVNDLVGRMTLEEKIGQM